MTLSEVAAPEVVELDLSRNEKITSLAAVGAAVGGAALPSLQVTRTVTPSIIVALAPAALQQRRKHPLTTTCSRRRRPST